MAPVPSCVPRRTRRSLRGMRWARRATSLRSLARYRGSSERDTPSNDWTCKRAAIQNMGPRSAAFTQIRAADAEAEAHRRRRWPRPLGSAAHATASPSARACSRKQASSALAQRSPHTESHGRVDQQAPPPAMAPAPPLQQVMLRLGVAVCARCGGREEGVAHGAGGARCACALFDLCLC